MSKHDFKAAIEKRLISYGAMSLAVASGFLAAPAAHAGIVYTQIGGPGPLNSTAAGDVYFNPVLGTYGNASTALFKMSHLGAHSGSGSRLAAFGVTSAAGMAGTSGLVAKLATGAITSFSNANFLGVGLLNGSDGSNNHQGNWNTDDNAFIGLIMAGNHYGWAHVQIQANYQAYLIGFAYFTESNDPGPGAGIPEPSSLMLLALGSAGIAAYRRKRALK